MIAEAPSSLRRLADVVEYLVDPRVGVVRRVEEVPREAGAPEFFHYVARACDTQAFTTLPNFGDTGGAAISRDQAIAKALGEAVERYCSAIFDLDTLPLAPADDAPFRCTDPREYTLNSDAQYADPTFPWERFEPSTTIRWCPATDLATGERWHVPAAMVYVPYTYYLSSGDSPIVQPISTGLACHASYAESAASGICEAIERDSFSIAWQARVSAPQILVETLSDANYDAVQRFERAGGDVTLLDITTDLGIPTVLAVLRTRSTEAPALVFAASAEADPEVAVRKSLEELAHTRRYAHQIKASVPRIEAVPGHANIQNQVHHLNFWVDHANAANADFVFASPRRVGFEELPSLATGTPDGDLRALVKRIGDAGHRALIADITTDDVADLGLVVVRAVIPGVHPLFMGHTLRALGGRRLWEVPQRLGHPGIRRETGDNPFPHPYP